MKALRYHGPRNLRLDDIEEPVCGKNQVKVRDLSLLNSPSYRPQALCWRAADVGQTLNSSIPNLQEYVEQVRSSLLCVSARVQYTTSKN